MEKNTSVLQKTLVIVIAVAILFTSGFVLGAMSAQIKALEAVQNTTVEDTTVTTTEPSTSVPTTAAPVVTTTAPATTETTTEAPSSTEATSDTTTTAPAEEETEEDEPFFLIKIKIAILEFCKKIIDFKISILNSL